MSDSHSESTFESMRESADGLRKILPDDFTPQTGIICGSGLSTLHLAVHEPRFEVPYSKIKGFPVSTGEPLKIFKLIYLVDSYVS